MHAVLSQAGLELVKRELQGSRYSEVWEQPRHHVHQACCLAFPFINIKPVAEAEAAKTCVGTSYLEQGSW